MNTRMNPSPHGWLRKLPILAICAVAIIGAVALRDQISFAALAEHRAALIAFRDAHFALAVFGFMAVYVLTVAFSLPGATVVSLAGGFLFGLFPGVVFNVVSATIGAVLIFLAARAGFGCQFVENLQGKSGALARIQAGLQENEWSVLLLMRLVPAVPFFLANLIPAFLGVRLDRFALTTFVGIIPAALVFTSIGSGLGAVFARAESPDLGLFFSPQVMGPILGLAALSALPMVLKLWRRKRG